MQRSSILAEDIKRHIGKRGSSLAGIGIDKGVALVDFPCQSDISDLDVCLGGLFPLVGADHSGFGIGLDGEKKQARGVVLSQHIVPVNLDGSRSIVGVLQLNDAVVNRISRHERPRKSVPLFDALVPRSVSTVVTIALKSSHRISAGQALGPYSGARDVHCSDAVGSVSGGQLSSGVARSSEDGRQMPKLNYHALWLSHD